MRAWLAAEFVSTALAGCTIRSDKCYYDKHTEQQPGVLPKSHDIPKLDREYCAQVCQNEGYKLAGVEFGQQCFCGNQLADYAQETSGCNMACTGNAGQICGGFDAINVMTFLCEDPPQPPSGGASEPYPPLHHFNATALPPRNSPDPLVRYKWDNSVDQSQLQLYHTRPVKVTPIPASSFLNADSLTTDRPNVTVLGPGRLELDFGVERAAWLEFNSSDLGPQYGAVKASISEYAYPWQQKTQQMSAYGDMYRLELNSQLYEGVRFAWIFFEPEKGAAVEPWHITDARAVAWVRPVSYHGAFYSDDAQLERVWYEGAYGVRLNMNAEDFGSILMDRGDRVSIQGDGHPTMASGLAAFGPDAFDLVRTMLGKTDSGCKGCHVVDDGLMSYPILWTMSVNEYFWASGDAATLAKLAPDIQHILDNSIASFLQGPPVEFMGWDDRLDNGFCVGPQCTPEAQFAFATLAARAVHDFAQSVRQISAEVWSGAAAVSAQYASTAADMRAKLRAQPGADDAPYYEAYGLHAAANAVNVPGLATAEEAAAMLSRVMNDSTTACSWSPFNQYWNLQALGNMGRMDYALANVRLCWGTQLSLMNGCFQELYNPEWAEMFSAGSKLPTRPSQCHPWSSGVTAWMSRSMLGVTPLLPGFERYLAVPFVPLRHVDYVAEEGGPATFRIGGAAAAPYGPVAVEAVSSVEGAQRLVAVTVEAARPGVVGLRASDDGGCRLQAVTVDGAAVTPVQLADTGLLHPLAAALHRFVEVPVGRHVVTAEYAAEGAECLRALQQVRAARVKEAAFPPYPPASYPASVMPLDRHTRGDWQGKYGSDGYLLFNFDSGKDVVKLPSYVHDVSPYKDIQNRGKFYGSDASNITYLEAPVGLSGRALGSVGEGCDDGCQGTVFDVSVTAGEDFLLSLYMVDTMETPDGDPIAREGQHVIRTMDLETLSPIAPESQSWIKDFEGGVYWTLRYHRGVRVRLMPLYKSARLSAMFWDRPSTSLIVV